MYTLLETKKFVANATTEYSVPVEMTRAGNAVAAEVTVFVGVSDGIVLIQTSNDGENWITADTFATFGVGYYFHKTSGVTSRLVRLGFNAVDADHIYAAGVNVARL